MAAQMLSKMEAEIAALRATVAAQMQTALNAAQRGAAEGISDGSRVQVHGLVNSTQLNAELGAVFGFDVKSGRYIVRLDCDSRPKSFHIENLKLVCAAAAAAAAKPAALWHAAASRNVDHDHAFLAAAMQDAEEELAAEEAADLIDLTQGGSSDEEASENEDEDDAAPALKKRRFNGSISGGGSSAAAAQTTKTKTRGRAKKPNAPPRPTVVVYMVEEDIPASPGPIVEAPLPGDVPASAAFSSSSSSSSSSVAATAATMGGVPAAHTSTGTKLFALKARIGKMLERGLHANTPEVEAQRCMRLAQKLLARHNLTQASIMADVGELRDEGAMKGGVVPTFLRKIPPSSKVPIPTTLATAPSQTAHLSRWVDGLSMVVASNFGTKVYNVKSRGKVWYVDLSAFCCDLSSALQCLLCSVRAPRPRLLTAPPPSFSPQPCAPLSSTASTASW